MNAWQTARMREPVGRTVVYTLGVVIAVGMFVLGSCGDDSSSTASTLRPIVTTSTVTPTVAPAATTAPITVVPATALPATAVPTTIATTVPVSSSTAPPSTAAPTTAAPTTIAPTTVPAGAALVLRTNGVGDAAFGADADEVVAYVNSILGAPTADSGWADPFSTFGVCPGTEVRGVTWGDLTLLFSDESVVASGRRHFFTYSYGPAFSVGDLNVAGALFRGLALDLSKWPKTQAWLKRCWDRPAAQKAKAMRG